MGYRLEDSQTALDIVEHSPSITLRSTVGTGPRSTLFAAGDIEHYGYSRDDFLSGQVVWEQLVHRDDLPGLRELRAGYEKCNIDRYTAYYRVLSKDGTAHWVSDSSSLIRDDGGGVLYIDSIISPQNEGVHSQAQIDESLKQQQILNQALDILHSDRDNAFGLVLDQVGEYLNLSRVALFEDTDDHTESCTIYEWTAPGIEPLARAGNCAVSYARDIPEIERGLEQDGQYIDSTGQASRMFGGGAASAFFAIYLNGERCGFICLNAPQPHVWLPETLAFLGNIARLVSTAMLRRSHAQVIRYLAGHDQLTGLANRYRFDEILHDSIARAIRSSRWGYVLFLDMDDFKIINEGYGHDYGDALLVTVSGYLRESYAGKADVFRFGGDEFALLVDSDFEGDVQEVIDSLVTRGRHPWQVQGREFYCTISIGVVRFPDGGATPTEVTKNADIAMYKAKNLGKNSYVMYNQNLDNESVQRAETEHRMREAIENEFSGFRVYYQPIVDIAGNITGAEALIRWADAAGNLTPPGKFIPLAEYLGLIVPLGDFVLREAALFCVRMNEVIPDFSVNVNISIRQFQQHDFLDKVEKTLTAAGVDFSNIVLEVTEGMMIQDIEHMQLMAEQLQGMGIRIAMDDFGTGYSSLNNMRTLPLDIIKIDRSFIRDVASDAYSKSFVHLITDLVHSMGRSVCVEGVENIAQYRYCTECKVDHIQGFYFYKPMPATQLRRLMTSDKSLRR